MSTSCPGCHKPVMVENITIKGYKGVNRVETTGTLHVTKRGRVVAQHEVVAFGGIEVHGQLHCKEARSAGPVILKAGCDWKGDLTAPSLIVEKGAMIQGGHFRIPVDPLADHRHQMADVKVNKTASKATVQRKKPLRSTAVDESASPAKTSAVAKTTRTTDPKASPPVTSSKTTKKIPPTSKGTAPRPVVLRSQPVVTTTPSESLLPSTSGPAKKVTSKKKKKVTKKKKVVAKKVSTAAKEPEPVALQPVTKKKITTKKKKKVTKKKVTKKKKKKVLKKVTSKKTGSK